MAYAAVISLKKTIESLVNTKHIQIVPKSSQKIIKLWYEVCSWQEILEDMNSTCISSSSHGVNMDRVNIFDGRIREKVCELEDVLESHISDQFLPHCHLSSFSLDLQRVHDDIDSFVRTVQKINKAYVQELHNPSKEEEDENALSSTLDLGNEEKKMVGLADQLMEIKDLLKRNYLLRTRTTTSIVGMAGIGKTTLVKEVLKDPSILSMWQTRAFVTVGPKYSLHVVLGNVLKQVNPYAHEELMFLEGEEKLVALKRKIYESLKNRTYLIVLDDVWSSVDWNQLNVIFPDEGEASQILLIGRIELWGNIYCVRFLDNKESWQLLREKVFGDEYSCSYELEKAGKKIAEKCEALPLTIVTVARILSKAEKTVEYWNRVADDEENSVFMDAYDQMLDVLYLSYHYLEQQLKSCFLYMGVFRRKHENSRSKICNLWIAERFFDKPDATTAPEPFALECLYILSSKNLVIVNKKSQSDQIKTVSLHSSYWYMCNKEAAKSKSFRALNSLADGLTEDLKSHRRLSVRNSMLSGIKDVCDSIGSISTVRSLLFTGPYHQYTVPICFGLMLLRVLDALAIRLYEFPIELPSLVQLTYLALTYDGNLPCSISKLWNLNYLIVRRHQCIIKSSDNSSYLPMEIWDMKELKHLQAMGSDLPHPCEGSLLPNLITLSDVSPRSCTEHVFRSVRCLWKLGIRIELAIDAAEPLNCFDHISLLVDLDKLKCVVVNPIITPDVVAPLVSLPNFSSGLEKLTLSGFGYPWEEISKISSLPNLRILKLRCYAFRGPEWEVHRHEFRCLEFLLIEDTDLVHWTFEDDQCLGNLESLSIKHCYKLEEIPSEIGESLKTIELVECNPLVVNYANKFKEGWDEKYGVECPFVLKVHSSWDS
ncbi:hypothetical protein ACP275_04G155200 [Erythranthe tilingii]